MHMDRYYFQEVVKDVFLVIIIIISFLGYQYNKHLNTIWPINYWFSERALE